MHRIFHVATFAQLTATSYFGYDVRAMKTASPRPAQALHTGGQLRSLALASLAFSLSPLTTEGVTMTFSPVTNNSPTDYSTSLSALVVDLGTHVLILISMDAAPPEGFINQVYFEDTNGLFADMSYSSTHSSGTTINYSSPATPAGPPGLNNLFVTAFSFDGDSPPSQHGANNSETVAFLASYAPGATFGLVEEAMTDEELRIALHLQGIDPDGTQSDTYLSEPPGVTPIPEPSAMLLALASCGLFLRRRRP